MSASVEKLPNPEYPSQGLKSDDPWHSSVTMPSEDVQDIRHHTRELRTTDAEPTAPRLEMLFRRGNTPPRQVVVVWDPGRRWPGFSIHALALAGSGELTDVRLRREGQAEALISLEHTVFKAGSGDIGVIHVRAAMDSPPAMRLALSLLEQADRAVLLAGTSIDAELVRLVRAEVADHQWEGPTLSLLSPSDKPSRAQRLRRLNWPIGMRAQVLEMPRSTNAGWSVQMIDTIMATGPTGLQGRNITASPRATPAVTSGRLAAAAERVRFTPAPDGTAGYPSTGQCELALSLMPGVPGVCAVGVTGTVDGTLLAHVGQAELARSGAHAAGRLWAAYAGNNPAGEAAPALDEFAWSAGAWHFLALPVPAWPGLLMVAAVDRAFGDVAQARWQLAVARHHLN